MPSQFDTETVDYSSNKLFTISDEKERHLTMSITQSNSFESSAQMLNMNMDGPDFTISLSASSDSSRFDENSSSLNLKGSLSDDLNNKKDSNIFGDNCEVSVVSSGGGHGSDMSTASSRSKESKSGKSFHQINLQKMETFGSQLPSQGPRPQGYNVQHYAPLPESTPQYFAHYHQQHYSNPCTSPQFAGGQAHPSDHRFAQNAPPGSFHASSSHPLFIHGMQYQQSNYHHHNHHHHQNQYQNQNQNQHHAHSGYPLHGRRPGPLPPPPPPPNASLNNSSISRNLISNKHSSAMSVSSNGSNRKRTIDGVFQDDAKLSGFTKHRSSSSSSTCSVGTAGNNTSSENINQMTCESPMKKERILSPEENKNRGDDSEAGANTLRFSGLTMGGMKKGQLNTKFTELRPRPIDAGVTPVTRITKKKSFSFDGESENQTKTFSPEEHSLKKQLRDQSFTPIQPSDIKRQPSASPTFNEQLEIVPQLSWSIADDTPALGDLEDWPKSEGKDLSPMSYNGNISPMMFSISPKNDADERNDSKECDEMMHMKVLSPSNDEKPSGTDSTPLSFSNNPVGSHQQMPDKCFSGPELLKKKPHTKHLDHHYRIHAQYQALTPTNSMPPMKSPQPYHVTMNPPTPRVLQNPSNFERREDTFNRNLHSSSRDAPSSENYQSPRNTFPSHIVGQDRIRNLRGRIQGALPPAIHLPPPLPSHHHFLTSPIGTTPRGMLLSSPQATINAQSFPKSPHQLNSSKRKCIPLKPPIPCKFQGDMEKMKHASVPEFSGLVNFPSHMSQKQAALVPEGMRCCVMCGVACPSTAAGKSKKGKSDCRGGMNTSHAIIPVQNKGLCTQCDVNVWVVTASKLEIKWCKGCKNFRPWAAFGEKGLATKCVRCRERQREKYAAQKEEKDKKKTSTKKKLT